MPEGPLKLKDIPGVTDLGNEEEKLPNELSEQASQALNKPVKPEEFQGKDWITTVRAPLPGKNGFEKSDFQPTTQTPESYKSEKPGWWERWFRGRGFGKAIHMLNMKREEANRRGQKET